MSHHCDERCVCPVHGTALIYAPASGEHACQDIDCVHGHGMRRQILDTYGLTEGDITVGFESLDAAETVARRMEADYLAALPNRAAKTAVELSEGLPSGLHFEWTEGDR